MRLALSPGFVVNDPRYEPFGVGALRGITPARLAVLAGVIAAFCSSFGAVPLARGEYAAALEAFLLALGRNFACAAPGFLLVIQVEWRTADAAPARRAMALCMAVVAAAALYAGLCWAVRYLHGMIAGEYWQLALAHTMRGLTVGALLAAVLHYAESERRAAERLHLARIGNAQLDRQIAEVRLQRLQSQIEPHFIFNCLASVKRLYEKDMQAARGLMLHLVEYLDVAGSRSAHAETTVADEMRLARSMLAIFKVRMGARLSVTYDVPPELEAARVPPLMVGTLIENAIKHGIAPRAAGGRIGIRVRLEGDTLEVTVTDDGVGFQQASGWGIGLANTRARLRTLFGAAAELRLQRGDAGGVTAAIRLPYRGCEAELAA